MTVSKMAAVGVLLLVCILVVRMVVGPSGAASSTQGVQSAGTVKGEVYEDAGLGFALEYPEDWVKAETPELGADVTFLGPQRSEFTMSLDVRSDPSRMALDLYVGRSVRKKLPGFRTDFKLLEQTPLVVSDVEAIKVVYTYREGQYDLTTVQVTYQLENRKIIVSFCLLSEYYDDVKSAVENTLNSFHPLG